MASESAVAFSAVATTAAAETLIATGPSIPEQNPVGQGVCVRGFLNITPGTATTAVVIRVRQGTALTGTLVGLAQTHTVTAGAPVSIPYEALDPTLNNLAGAQYTLSVQQTSGTAAGTVNYGTLGQSPVTAFVG